MLNHEQLYSPQPLAYNRIPDGNRRHNLLLGWLLRLRYCKYQHTVYTLPKHLDEKVAAFHLAKVGAKLTQLSPRQAEYIGVPSQGPFKHDLYRY